MRDLTGAGAEFTLDGRLRLDEMVSLRLDLDRINAGYEAMLAGEVVRAAVQSPRAAARFLGDC